MTSSPEPQWTVCLDLEGTLLSTAVSQIPRPGLGAFLESLAALEVRLWIFTSVPEDRVRQILQTLADESTIPSWASALPVVPWARSSATKPLESVPEATVSHTLLVDDMPVVAPEHRAQWMPVTPFDGTDAMDTELERVAIEVRRRIRPSNSRKEPGADRR